MTIEVVLGEALVVAGVLGVAAKILEQPSGTPQSVAVPVRVKDSENSKKR